MKLSAAAATNEGEVIIATYSGGNITISRNDGTGLTTHLGSLNSCDDLEAICIAAVGLLAKLKAKGLALSDVDRIGELQQDLRKLTLKTINDGEVKPEGDVDF